MQASPDGPANLDISDLGEEDGCAVLGLQDDALEVLDACSEPDRANDVFFSISFDELGADVQVVLADSPENFARSEVVSKKVLGVNQDMKLLLLASNSKDFRDTGNGLEFFNDTATTEIYTLSLRDALPICVYVCVCEGVCVCECV